MECKFGMEHSQIMEICYLVLSVNYILILGDLYYLEIMKKTIPKFSPVWQ